MASGVVAPAAVLTVATQDAAGVESDVETVLQRERTAGEPGARQQEHRKRELQHDQAMRQPRPSLDDTLLAHLEERQQLLVTGAERGPGGDRDRTEQRKTERICDHGPVGCEIRDHHRRPRFRHEERHDRFRDPPGEQAGRNPGDHRQDQALGQEAADDPSA